MADYYQTCPQPKGERRKRVKARKLREFSKRRRNTREYIFGRERNICRICRFRPAETMHELIPRSLKGRISASNSVAVCGDGVRGCHGYAQRHEIQWDGEALGAEGALWFTPRTSQAADWLRVALGQRIESLPMIQMEEAI